MTKLTFKREDWTGNDETIVVNENEKTFELFDYTFKLIQKDEFKDPKFGHERYWECFYDEDDAYPIVSIVEDVVTGTYDAYEYRIDEGSLNREDTNLYIATAKVLTNII